MTLEPNTKKRCLAAAKSIADRLLAKAKRDEEGLSWLFTSQNTELKPVEYTSYNLYSGVAGVALFFTELFVQTEDEQYLTVAREAFDKTIARLREEPQTPAFFTGRLGVSTSLCRFAEITGDKRYLDHAMAIAEPAFDPETSWPAPVDDLLNGRSGTMLGLLHLHAATGRSETLQAALHYADYLAAHTWPAPKGYYWYRTRDNIIGLCGFSHGAAGNGFAFNEMAYYLHAPVFLELGKLAFDYENRHYSPKEEAWADLRNGIFNAEDEAKALDNFNTGNWDFFYQPKYMDAWCHGSPGIGLARLAQVERTGDEDCRRDLFRAIERTKRIAPRKTYSQTICHGLFGDLELLLEASFLLDDPTIVTSAAASGGPLEKALEEVESGKPLWSGYAALETPVEDLSLFMGIAGIGYSMLRWHDPKRTPSVLLPMLPHRHPDPPAFAPAQIRRSLLQIFCQRSLELVDKKAPRQLAAFLENPGTDFQTDPYSAYLAWAAAAPDIGSDAVIADLLTLEKEKFQLDRNIESLAFHHARALAHAHRVNQREADFKGTTQVVSHPDLKILETKHPWTSQGTAAAAVAEPSVTMLLPTADGTVEDTLTHFSQAVFSSCREPQTVDQIVATVAELFEWETEEERTQIQDFTFRQVQEGLRSGVLFFAEEVFMSSGKEGPH